MPLSKEEVESRLKYLLYELLRYGNQEDGIISLEYDEGSETCTVKMNVCLVEEDDYVGFSGY
jgi:hypothetical protein